MWLWLCLWWAGLRFRFSGFLSGRAVVVAVYDGTVLLPLCVLSGGLLVLVSGCSSAVLRGWLAVSRVGAAVAGASVAGGCPATVWD